MTPIAARAGLSLIAAALVCGGCGSGPAGPRSSDSMVFAATMINAAGQSTIGEISLQLNGAQIESSCPPPYIKVTTDAEGNVLSRVCTEPPQSSFQFNNNVAVHSGPQTLAFVLVSQTGPAGAAVNYTVAPMTLHVYDPNGNLIETLSLPGRTVSLVARGSITYDFTI